MKPKSGPGKVIFLISFVWLAVLTAFTIGVYVYAAKKWPYPLIAEIEKFVAGDKEETKTLVEKVKNDLNFKPTRHIISSQREDLFSGKYTPLADLPVKARRSKPLIFLSPKAPEGYRLIYGAFDMEKSFHGAILLNKQGEVSHHWNISQENVAWDHRPDKNVFPHGIEVARDGSIVVAYDSGNSLTRYDYCSEVVWQLKGNFHHSVAFDNDNSIWAWGIAGKEKGYGMNLTKVDYGSGEVLKSFPLQAVMEANPDIDIFSILQVDSKTGSEWVPDRWHPNDIEPLPEAWIDNYPDFQAGDLLVSLRSPDLIFVINPDTLEVKWWRQGLARRPHDPDWNSKGTISIFNNNMHRGFSSIVEIDPVSYRHKTLVDGEKYDFYTWHQGKHQVLDTNGVLVTSPQQGWVFETDESGEIVFEFLNYYGGKKEFIKVSEARFLPTNFFKELPVCR